MARIAIPAGDIPESHRLMQVETNFGTAMATTAIAIYEQSPLDKRVREAVRYRIAQINQCQICLHYRFPELQDLGINEDFYQAIDNYQKSDLLSDAEKLAVEYAELFLTNHLAISDDFFKKLHQHFSNQDIFVLTSTIAGLMANGRIMQVLQVEQSCSLHFDSNDQLA